MNAMDNDTANLTRRCRINGVLIRNDGLVCTFDAGGKPTPRKPASAATMRGYKIT